MDFLRVILLKLISRVELLENLVTLLLSCLIKHRTRANVPSSREIKIYRREQKDDQ